MSSLDIIAEALRDLNRIETFDISEAQINHDDEIVHFTNSLKNLRTILWTKTLQAGKNANGISFTQGFDDITDTPLQTLRKSKWMFGLGIDINKIETKSVHDARNRLSGNNELINRTELLQVCDLCKMSNGDCWINIRYRDLPIPISEDFYEYLVEVLNFQSEGFLRSHTNTSSTTTNEFISTLSQYYAYEGKNVQIKEYKGYRTPHGSAVGVYITGNPEYKIKGIKRNRSGSHERRITSSDYLYTLKLLSKASVVAKEFEEELKETPTASSKLKDNLTDITKYIKLLNSRIQDINDSEILQSLVTFDDEKQELETIDIDLTQQWKQLKQQLKRKIKYILSIINSMDKQIKEIFQTPNVNTSNVGGAIIFIEDKYMHELTDSISLDERERLFEKDKELNFEIEDIKYFYFPEVVKLANNYSLNLKKLADLRIQNHERKLDNLSINDVIETTADKIPQKVREDGMDLAGDFIEILKTLDYNRDKLKPYNKNQRISLR